MDHRHAWQKIFRIKHRKFSNFSNKNSLRKNNNNNSRSSSSNGDGIAKSSQKKRKETQTKKKNWIEACVDVQANKTLWVIHGTCSKPKPEKHTFERMRKMHISKYGRQIENVAHHFLSFCLSNYLVFTDYLWNVQKSECATCPIHEWILFAVMAALIVPCHCFHHIVLQYREN